MFTIDLSDGSKLKADVALTGTTPALVITQARPADAGSQIARLAIPLTDLKRLSQAVGSIVKIFRG